MTNDQIKKRIQGRKDATEALGLVNDTDDDWQRGYWQTVAYEAKKALYRLGLAEPPRPRLVPMSDGESRLFAETPMPFGKYKDTAVWAVMRDDDAYLDWLVRATEEDCFKENLRRYLARPEFLNEDSAE